MAAGALRASQIGGGVEVDCPRHCNPNTSMDHSIGRSDKQCVKSAEGNMAFMAQSTRSLKVITHKAFCNPIQAGLQFGPELETRSPDQQTQ